MRANPREIIRRVNKGIKVADVASALGIHRSTVYRWMKRAVTVQGTLSSLHLERKSTKPHTIHRYNFTNREKIDIERYRKHRGQMAEKIVRRLHLEVSWRTVHRFLKQKNLVREYGYHRRPRFQDTVHMHLGNTKTIGYLQMDVKYVTPELSGLTWTCFEYAVIDIFSKEISVKLYPSLTAKDGLDFLNHSFTNRFNHTNLLQTDGGPEFKAEFREHALDYANRLRVSRPYKKNEQSYIESFNRSLRKECLGWSKYKPKDLPSLSKELNDYLVYYHTKRPHMSLNMKTPDQFLKEYQVSDF